MTNIVIVLIKCILPNLTQIPSYKKTQMIPQLYLQILDIIVFLMKTVIVSP
jgi:hypothetical protein